MRNVWLLARRELGAYIRSPLGYVVVAVVLFVDGLLYNHFALGGAPKYSSEVLQKFFEFATFMSMVSGVLLAMRLIAEERQLDTLTFLLTAPIRDHEIVLGKFVSALIFFTGMTLLTLYMPLLILVNGKIAPGHIAAGYCGLILVGALSLSVGLFASAISKSQVVAAVVGGAILTTMFWLFLGANQSEPPLREILSYVSTQRHLKWYSGVIQTRDVFYYLSATYFWLLLTTHVLQARRWR